MQVFKYIQSTVTLIFFLFISVNVMSGCSKDENIGLPPSLQELTEQADCICDPFIDEYTFNENTIYLYSCKGPACDCMTLYYNGAGEKFELPARQSIAFVRHVWSCEH